MVGVRRFPPCWLLAHNAFHQNLETPHHPKKLLWRGWSWRAIWRVNVKLFGWRFKRFCGTWGQFDTSGWRALSCLWLTLDVTGIKNHKSWSSVVRQNPQKRIPRKPPPRPGLKYSAEFRRIYSLMYPFFRILFYRCFWCFVCSDSTVHYPLHNSGRT